jgi:phosphate transport system substrate-binding protein
MRGSNGLLIVGALAIAAVDCSKHKAGSPDEKRAEVNARGNASIITIDGSSTVFPISEAVAEEFGRRQKVKVTIGVSGSGGGFQKFCRGEIDINGASRPITGSELRLCRENGIRYIELPVAYDGVAVVVHEDATWVDKLTVAELKRIWAPEAQGRVVRWDQVRTGWPEREIHLFAPGIDSGTYDYFCHAILGEERGTRGDLTSSEDDNVLVQGVAGDPGALGFFGLAYYAESKDKLKIVPIDDGNDDNGAGAVAPSVQTVSNGTYQPLSRPLFIYLSRRAASREKVRSFVDFYLSEGRALVKEVGYVPLSDEAYALARARFEKRIVGSVFGGRGSEVGVTIEDLLTK